MNTIKCAKCGLVSYAEANSCKRCGSVITASSNIGQSSDPPKQQYPNTASATDQSKINILATISIAVTIVSAIVIAINGSIASTMYKYAFVAFSSFIGMIIAIVAYSQANRPGANNDKRVPITALVVSGLILNAVMTLAAFQSMSLLDLKYQKKDYALDKTWQDFTSSTGKYSIKMPGKPKEKTQELDTKGGQARMYVSELNLLDGTCMSAYVDYYGKNPQNNYNDPEIIDNILKNAINGFIEGTKGELVSSKPIKLDVFKGLEAEAHFPATGLEPALEATYRVFWVQEKLFMVGIAAKKNGSLYQNRAKLFDSFKISGITEGDRFGYLTGDQSIGNEYERAVTIAKRAKELSLKANNLADWENIATQWQQALNIMDRIKSSNPNATESLLYTYRNELQIATEKINALKTPVSLHPSIGLSDKAVTIPPARNLRSYVTMSTNLKDYDYISNNFTSENGELSVGLNPANRLYIEIKGKGPRIVFYLMLPDNEKFSLDTYNYTVKGTDRYKPGITIDGMKLAGNQFDSRIQINQIFIDAKGRLTFLDAVFEHRCQDNAIAVAGRVHYDTRSAEVQDEKINIKKSGSSQ